MRISDILADPAVAQELDRKFREVDTPRPPADAGELAPAARAGFLPGAGFRSTLPFEASSTQQALFSIILEVGRPVVLIQNNTFQVPPDSDLWQAPLEAARSRIETAALSVGRINLGNHPDVEWAGTGWLIADNLLVTNRHVAVVFAQRSGNDIVFQPGADGGPVRAWVDFRQEHGVAAQEPVQITRVHYMADGPDVAFLELAPAPAGSPRRAPLPLAASVPPPSTALAVIGYPTWDERRNDPAVMQRIFQGIYSVKRLSPGRSTASDIVGEIGHDCTTLGGNSGSPVLSLDTGEVIGLHYSGKVREVNHAVPAPVVASLLGRL